MNLDNIFEALERIVKNLDGLITASKKQMEILLQGDFSKLNEILLEQERWLLAIQNAEDDRNNEIDKLCKEYNLQLPSYRIGEFVQNFIKFIDNEKAEKLLNYSQAIKNKALALTELNMKNFELIAASKNIIDETIKKIFSTKNSSIIDMRM